MQRIALIHRNEPSGWTSCRSITHNLRRAYELAFPNAELRSFFLEESATSFDGGRLAQEVASWAPAAVAIIDHAPHPAAFLRGLLAARTPLQPKILIHVFGDFMLKPAAWLGCEEALKQADFRFCCASEKQALLVRAMVDGERALVVEVPFPVDATEFKVQRAEGLEFRSDAGTAKKDSVFLYTGRLSAQKNLLLLIRAFKEYQRQINPGSELWLAGPVDDLGVPYLGRETPSGVYASDLLGAAGGFHVRYLGDLNTAQLRRAYNASDYFISFSTHNDEDFGMSPAEALFCGLPVILSDWGGYSSFRRIDPTACRHVPVRLSHQRVAPDPLDCIKTLVAAPPPPSPAWPEERRQAIATAARGYCGCEAVAKRIRTLLEDKPRARFSGFTQLFRRVGAAFSIDPKAPFRRGDGYSDLYREVYSTYV